MASESDNQHTQHTHIGAYALCRDPSNRLLLVTGSCGDFTKEHLEKHEPSTP